MPVQRTATSPATGEHLGELVGFLRDLPGAPPVHEVVVLSCAAHGEERPTWAYVEADARAGLARRRCVACATVVPLLDSAERWTYPPMHACRGCRQSIVEVAAGLHVPDGAHVGWVAVAARCVGCDRLTGLTDLVVPGLPVAEVRARL